ncbi:arsenic metallochaperone ArsD family protein [Ectothiorhodospira sp. 9100]|uniref:arsenic metallochaperone ArsD family protein n=1 Tax=unclassified Ectothiorhodospira TaxID=2684909 RepID=UPI001EE8E897|nr:arsenic metallochaperone ArsD family protein [Ectothiorhodospira sp. 9100]MCG5519942.1 arsenic metallochaperone ArsD family protein [Ectothiorhodospira sp. 9905]
MDPRLSRLAGDLAWLRDSGVSVTRYNLSQQPGAFVENATIQGILEKDGEDALSITPTPLPLVGEGLRTCCSPWWVKLYREVS